MWNSSHPLPIWTCWRWSRIMCWGLRLDATCTHFSVKTKYYIWWTTLSYTTNGLLWGYPDVQTAISSLHHVGLRFPHSQALPSWKNRSPFVLCTQQASLSPLPVYLFCPTTTNASLQESLPSATAFPQLYFSYCFCFASYRHYMEWDN